MAGVHTIMPTQLNVSQIMSPSENSLKDALDCTELLACQLGTGILVD